MGSYFTLHAYDADVWIPAFRGLDQSDVGLNPNTMYAAEAQNVETIDGVLQPMAGVEIVEGSNGMETLAGFHRRWYKGSGSKDWFVGCRFGKFYQKQMNSSSEWQAIDLPIDIVAYQSSKWSWVTYEENTPGNDTVDVILMSNGLDGMIEIIPPDRPTIWGDVDDHDWTWAKSKTWGAINSEDWHIVAINTGGKKFGVIERYAERIWGGAITDNPDMLMYSKPYDPTDWTADPDIPEDGAGDVMQPSWDGDQFYALKRFGDHLLAFKKNKIWRVLNTNPGEYIFQEQFSEGTEYYNTIAVYKEKVFMATDDGLVVYDGMSTSPYMQEQVKEIWKQRDKYRMERICGTIYNDKYYLSFTVPDPTPFTLDVNNAMLVYDLKEGKVLYYTHGYNTMFLINDELYGTSGGIIRIYKILENSWDRGRALAGMARKACRWVSPWMDFGYKRINKGGFDLYFIPEVQDNPVTLTISVQTEKKKKTKQYTIQPLTEEQKQAGKEHRGKRLHFGGAGRKFRVIIEVDEHNWYYQAPWRLIGGIQMVVETDPD